MPAYVVDSNFFIQAHRFVYPLDVVPGFWVKVKHLADNGIIESIDKVKDEICGNKDVLSDWITNNINPTFFKETGLVLNEYRQISKWATNMSSHYSAAAIAEFLDANEADAWLVSHALANTSSIITHEIAQPLGKRKIKIPEPCNHFKVPYLNTIEMFRQLGQTF